MKDKFRGTGVALVTPFDKDLQLDVPALQRLVAFVTENGADYLVVQGTTGESATTTAEEKAEILRVVQAENNGKLPIVFGAGSNNTAEVIDFFNENSSLPGVDGILSVCPYYNKPSQEGIYQHFMAVAARSPVPVIIYNVPNRTSVNIEAETTLRLAEHPNIIGIKEASGDLVQAMKIARNKPEDFILLSGDDLLSVPLISIGAEGVISVMANGFPDIFKEMIHSALGGDFARATAAASLLLDINPLMYAESNPVGIKQVLEIQGICHAYVRPPLLTATEQLKTAIQNLLKKMH